MNFLGSLQLAGTRFAVSDLLERKASEAEKKQGLDLADYLIRFDYKEFALPKTANKPVPLRNDLLNILSNDFLYDRGGTHTDETFQEINIYHFEDRTGNVYELLFNKNGELIIPGQQPEAVQHLANFFEKKLIPARVDNSLCWVHIDKRSIVNNN